MSRNFNKLENEYEIHHDLSSKGNLFRLILMNAHMFVFSTDMVDSDCVAVDISFIWLSESVMALDEASWNENSGFGMRCDGVDALS